MSVVVFTELLFIIIITYLFLIGDFIESNIGCLKRVWENSIISITCGQFGDGIGPDRLNFNDRTGLKVKRKYSVQWRIFP